MQEQRKLILAASPPRPLLTLRTRFPLHISDWYVQEYFPDITCLQTVFGLQAKYLGNYWGLTKFCVAQFNGSRVNIRKADSTKSKQFLAKSKDYDGVKEVVGSWTGENEMKEITRCIDARPLRHRDLAEPGLSKVLEEKGESEGESEEKSVEKTETSGSGSSSGTDDMGGECTPEGTRNPESPGPGAPRPVAIDPRYITLARDRTTPTPSGRLAASS